MVEGNAGRCTAKMSGVFKKGDIARGHAICSSSTKEEPNNPEGCREGEGDPQRRHPRCVAQTEADQTAQHPRRTLNTSILRSEGVVTAGYRNGPLPADRYA